MIFQPFTDHPSGADDELAFQMALSLMIEARRHSGRPIARHESFARHWLNEDVAGGDGPALDLLCVLAPRWVVDALLSRLLDLADGEIPPVDADAQTEN